MLCVLAYAGLSMYPSIAGAGLITIVEFYNTTLKHYVLITDPDEVAAIERGAAGPGWERTGGSLMAYSKPDDVPGLVPVCRFYGNVAQGGPNSHFFTADPAECAQVKLDPGWTFESIAFYVRLTAGTTAVSTKATTTSQAVCRAYNNGFKPQLGINDGNHRFSCNCQTISDMAAQGWTNEGTVFYVPGCTGPGPGQGLSATCFIPRPGFAGTYSAVDSPVTQRVEISGTPASPTVLVTVDQSPVTATSRTTYTIGGPISGRQVMSWDVTHNEVIGPFVHIHEDISVPQALALPMQPQEIQHNDGNVSGSHSIETPQGTCTSPITGGYHTSYQFLGRQKVTVAAGSYNACTFLYRQTVDASIECPLPSGARGFGWGGATDETFLWFDDNVGFIGSGSLSDLGIDLSTIISLP
jgi:hypothetical protein